MNLELHVLHLRRQQVLQGGDLCLGVVSHLSKVRVQSSLQVLHVLRGAGLKLLEILCDVSEKYMFIFICLLIA